MLRGVVQWLAVTLLLTPVTAFAQAEVWAISRPHVGSIPIRLVRANLDTLETRVLVEFPNPHCMGGSAAASDGSTFYLVAGSDLHRFTMQSATPLPIVTSPLSCEDARQMYVSPDDRWWYFWGTSVDGLVTRYSIVDANSRQIVHTESLPDLVPFVVFTPDGALRIELRVNAAAGPSTQRVRAVSEPATTTALWEFGLGIEAPYVADITATNTTVYLLLQVGAFTGEQQIRAYDVHTGAEQARVRVAPVAGHIPMRIRVASGRLYLAGARIEGSSLHLLVATYDPTSLALGPSVSHLVGPANVVNGTVAFSPDQSVLHVFHRMWYPGRPGTDLRHTAFEAKSLRVLGDNFLAPDTTVSHVAFGSPPGVPTASEMSIEGDRIRPRWQPTSGPPPRWFTIRGARRGEPTAVITSTAGSARSWQSSALPPGSYTLAVSAVNSAGTSAGAARVDFSVSEPRTPGAPIQLLATSADDVAHVMWQPAPDGAAPAGYIVEAASLGSIAWGEVGRVTLPELRATQIPEGIWQARLRAFTTGGVSDPSSVVTLSSNRCSSASSAPTALEAIVTGLSTAGGALVTLRWEAPVTGSADNYVLEAGTASGMINVGRVVLGTARPSVDMPATPGTYYVHLRARNSCGESAASNEIVVVVR